MMGYGFGATGMIFMSLFWLLVIGLVVWGVTSLLPRDGSARDYRPERPEEILDRRFALGEIDAERYRQAREQLATSRTARR